MLLTREMKIISVRYHLLPMRLAKIKKNKIKQCYYELGNRGVLSTAGGNVEFIEPFGKIIWTLLKIIKK